MSTTQPRADAPWAIESRPVGAVHHEHIDESRAAKITPVLVTPVARRTFENGKAATSLTPYADAMKKVGREKQAPVVDLHAASFELFARLGDEGSADLTAATTDRTHFSRKGGRTMARLVDAALPRALPQLISFLNEAATTAEPGPTELPGLVRLALPPVIDACVGIETNIYFDNVMLVLNAANYAVDVNYPEESVAWNADTEVKGLRQNNGVHPAKPGYDQIGDAVYAWLKGNVK